MLQSFWRVSPALKSTKWRQINVWLWTERQYLAICRVVIGAALDPSERTGIAVNAIDRAVFITDVIVHCGISSPFSQCIHAVESRVIVRCLAVDKWNETAQHHQTHQLVDGVMVCCFVVDRVGGRLFIDGPSEGASRWNVHGIGWIGWFSGFCLNLSADYRNSNK